MKSYRPKSNTSDPLELFKRIAIRITLSLILSLAIVYTIKHFILFPYKVENNFMAPEFKKDSKVYLSYLFEKDKLLIGDVVMVRLNSSNSILLARIVGRKGDRISLKNKKLFRNGNLISESDKILFTDKRSPFSGSFSKRDNLDEVFVKEKTYFLLADNRDEGVDSRQLGLISQEAVIGKLLF